jgi:uncharacterized protein (DUF2141 family)
MKTKPTGFACLVLLLLATHAAHAADVTVKITNVRNDHGRIRVALCQRATFLAPHCPWQGSAPATPGEVTVLVKNVPPGTYAAQAFHDEDGNGTLERNFLGLPREGMGFSNNAPMHFGPPRYDTAAFTVDSKGANIAFRLKYY